MEKVILETIQRGIHQYHKIDSFPVTVGRAFDNDIILQDVSISPHHLLITQVITQENEQLFIQNLTDEENGTRLNGSSISNKPVKVSLPVNILISDLKARLLSSEMPVEKTHVRSCKGFFCLFSNPIWSLLLLITTVGFLFLEKFLVTPVAKEPLYYMSNVLPSVWIILGITVVISGISRLSTHRWEIVPAISIASLIFLVPQLFEYLGHHLSYLFTSDEFSSWLTYSAKFIVIPILLAVFIVKTIRTKWLPAIGVATLVYSPFIAFQLLGVVDDLTSKSGFSEIPSYSQTLLSGDTRLNATISLDQFIKEAEKENAQQVQEMLEAAERKEKESQS